MLYIRFFLRCLGIGVLVSFLPLLAIEFLDYCNNKTGKCKETKNF